MTALVPEYFQVNRLDADAIGYNSVRTGSAIHSGKEPKSCILPAIVPGAVTEETAP